MGSDNGAKTGKLAKLTRLEDEVIKLSEQLKANKKTVSLLKKSLTERDLKIHELESKLIYAQQSLLKKLILNIHQCRNQIKNGIDEKIINPALAHIKQQLEIIQGLVHEANELINKKKILIHANIDATSHRVHQCPDQAIRYFEKTVVEPSRLLVNDLVGLIDSNVKNSRDLLELKIIYPGKLCYDKIVVAAQTWPTQTQIIFQAKLVKPTQQTLEALPVIGGELRAQTVVLLSSVFSRLKSEAEQGLESTADAIKKSPFWDGKRKMEAA